MSEMTKMPSSKSCKNLTKIDLIQKESKQMRQKKSALTKFEVKDCDLGDRLEFGLF